MENAPAASSCQAWLVKILIARARVLQSQCHGGLTKAAVQHPDGICAAAGIGSSLGLGIASAPAVLTAPAAF